MKSFVLNIFLASALLSAVGLAGCATDAPVAPDDGPPDYGCMVSIAEAESVNNVRSVETDGRAAVVKFMVRLSEVFDGDIEVNLGVNAGSVSIYNDANGTSYAMLPGDMYSFGTSVADKSVTIASGSVETEATLNIYWVDPQPGSITYLLPVCISSAVSGENGVATSGNPYYIVVRFDIPERPFVHPTYGRIPVLRISTGAGSYNANTIKKDVLIPASMTIEDPDGLYSSVAYETIDMEIKGRGNTTWGLDKKPYKLKLDKKKSLLGMPQSKHFVLLANQNDKTLLRNNVAFKLSEAAGMMWAPRWVPVEVYVDNSFRGQYMLTEHVRAEENRIEVDIAENGETEGGYLFCIDYKEQDQGTPGWLQLPKDSDGNNRMYFAFTSPETPTAQQINWAKNYVNKVQTEINKATTTPSGYCAALAEVIDVSSFIQYFFVQEITKNIDGNMRLSTPVALPRGGKLFFPCVWDFDLALGCTSYHSGEQAGANGTYSGWYVRNSKWLRVMFKNDEFCNRVKAEWNELYPKLLTLEAEFRSWAALINDAQKRNFTSSLWGTVNYANEVDNMLKFYTDRIAWMNTEINAGRHKYTGSLN